ncbi:MAG: SGNH/GDSL hydrolase family protein [Clostridia bacterium]|nr:SGNH/GDSL hydrolase family protein [Clostridia bacterium]
MKSLFKKILIPILCVNLTSCTMIYSENQSNEDSLESQSIFDSSKDSESQSESVKPEYSQLLPYDHFDLNTYMKPIWLGDTIYNETVVFVGENDFGKLLYPAEEIISVTSYDLKTSYQKEVDYVYDPETNSILRTKNSSMPFFYEAGFYPQTGTYNSYSKNRGLLFSEGPTFSNKHVAVTYRTTKDDRITSPIDHSTKYTDILSKMQNGENVKICFFGDSITVGGNGSGFLGIEPNMPGFDTLVTESLKQVYNNPNISFVNRAKGGETSLWGYNNIHLVTDENPDLAILCWGMNDLGMSWLKFKQQLEWQIDEIKKACPNTAILLVSSMLPNGDVKEFNIRNDYENCNMILLEQAQLELAEKYGLGIATVTTMHKEILRYKNYYSMTGNNVNHPTDFIIRVYAQNILYALTGKTL